MKAIASYVLLLLHLTGFNHFIPSGGLERMVLARNAAQQNPAQTLNYQTSPRPLASRIDPVFKLRAVSVYAFDRHSGVVLYSQNATEQRPIASITKLASLLVLLRRHKPQEVVTIGKLPSYGPDDAVMGLAAGQVFSYEALLAAMLIKSANDAADALAIYDAGSLEAFISQMNIVAHEWSISPSHFSSPSGLVDAGNYATAESLAKLAALAIDNPMVRELVNTGSKQVQDNNGKVYKLTSTNQLLKDERFHGIKTGYTLAAGQSVVALATVDGHEIITVVLGSPDRFGETTQLVNYLQGAYTWQ